VWGNGIEHEWIIESDKILSVIIIYKKDDNEYKKDSFNIKKDIEKDIKKEL
jgi:hypothetical protein